MERRITTMHGNPLTLLGKALKPGDKAPDFTLLTPDLETVTLQDYRGKRKIISVVPSLDTGVCDKQTRKFNEIAAGMDQESVILTVSMDLPFAQKRWCGAAGIDAVEVLSDHREAAFGTAYGVLIKELRLLNRSIFVIDSSDTIRYIDLVLENSEHPDYDAALKAFGDTP